MLCDYSLPRLELLAQQVEKTKAERIIMQFNLTRLAIAACTSEKNAPAVRQFENSLLKVIGSAESKKDVTNEIRGMARRLGVKRG